MPGAEFFGHCSDTSVVLDKEYETDQSMRAAQRLEGGRIAVNVMGFQKYVGEKVLHPSISEREFILDRDTFQF
jgi:hypothetical protein